MTKEQQFHIEAQIQMNLQNEGERIQTKGTSLGNLKVTQESGHRKLIVETRASVAKRLTLLAVVQ